MPIATTPRARLARWLVDDRIVTAVIVLNALVQFLRAYDRWENHGLLFAIDYACTVFFVVELVAKVGLEGFPTYWRSGLNKFDFIIVVASAPHLLTPFVDVRDLALLLLLRMVRLVRVLRLLEFIPGRDRLLTGAIQALRASVGLFFALLVYNFMLGLTACYLFRETGSPYFADPITAMYSMFKVFTIEGWYDIPESVALDASNGMGIIVRCFFIFSVLTGGILGISLANAVFVDRMVADNNDELERLVGHIHSAFEDSRDKTNVDLARIYAMLAVIESRLADLDRAGAKGPDAPPEASSDGGEPGREPER